MFGSGCLQFEDGALAGEHGFEVDFGSVDGFAGGGAVLLGEAAELLHQGSELAMGSEPSALGLFERGDLGGGFELGQRGPLEWFEILQQRRHKRASA